MGYLRHKIVADEAKEHWRCAQCGVTWATETGDWIANQPVPSLREFEGGMRKCRGTKDWLQADAAAGGA